MNQEVPMTLRTTQLHSISNLAQDALQAAHDIQSPVTALQAVILSIEDLDDRKKKLAQAALSRVQEITEGLLNKYCVSVETKKIREPNQNLRLLFEQII